MPLAHKKAAPQHCDRICKMAGQLGFYRDIKQRVR